MRRISASVLAALTLFTGCAGSEKRPEPTKDEWEHAVEEKGESEGRGPRVVEATPRLLEPRDGVFLSREDLEPEQNLVVFSWSSAGDRSAYVLELARDANFTRVVYEKHTIHNVLAYRLRSPGRYFWRVRTGGGLVSNVQRLSVLAVRATGRKR